MKTIDIPIGIKDYMVSCGKDIEQIANQALEIIGLVYGTADGEITGVSLYNNMDITPTTCVGNGIDKPDNRILLGRIHTHPRFPAWPSPWDENCRFCIAHTESELVQDLGYVLQSSKELGIRKEKLYGTAELSEDFSGLHLALSYPSLLNSNINPNLSNNLHQFGIYERKLTHLGNQLIVNYENQSYGELVKVKPGKQYNNNQTEAERFLINWVERKAEISKSVPESVLDTVVRATSDREGIIDVPLFRRRAQDYAKKHGLEFNLNNQSSGNQRAHSACTPYAKHAPGSNKQMEAPVRFSGNSFIESKDFSKLVWLSFFSNLNHGMAVYGNLQHFDMGGSIALYSAKARPMSEVSKKQGYSAFIASSTKISIDSFIKKIQPGVKFNHPWNKNIEGELSVKSATEKATKEKSDTESEPCTAYLMSRFSKGIFQKSNLEYLLYPEKLSYTECLSVMETISHNPGKNSSAIDLISACFGKQNRLWKKRINDISEKIKVLESYQDNRALTAVVSYIVGKNTAARKSADYWGNYKALRYKDAVRAILSTYSESKSKSNANSKSNTEKDIVVQLGNALSGIASNTNDKDERINSWQDRIQYIRRHLSSLDISKLNPEQRKYISYLCIVASNNPCYVKSARKYVKK